MPMRHLLTPISAESWTVAKSADASKNEDRILVGDEAMALADGATDKTGIIYRNGFTGGANLADIAVQTAVKSRLNGYELIDEITASIKKFYESDNLDALNDSSKRAATTLMVARFSIDKLIITQVGDSSARIRFADGSQAVLSNDKFIDEENATTRQRTISEELMRYRAERNNPADGSELDRIMARGRAAIQQRLSIQHIYQNSDNDQTYGYGVLDGTTVPRTYTDGTPTSYVKTYEYEMDSIESIELVTDGFYGQFPADATIAAYRKLHAKIHADDPYKISAYPSTKPNDDASVVISSR